MKILGISGSLSKSSRTIRVLEVALDGAQKAGAETRVLDMRDYKLDFCDARPDFESYSPDTVEVGSIIKRADALIVVTPIYHASYSGVVKNLFDIVPSDYYSGKVVGLIAASPKTRFPLAIELLRQLFSYVGCVTIPGHMVLTFEEVDKVYSLDLNVKERVMGLGANVVRLSESIKNAHIPLPKPDSLL